MNKLKMFIYIRILGARVYHKLLFFCVVKKGNRRKREILKGGRFIKKYYTAKYDIVFKTIFCDSDNNPLLIALLSDILERNISNLRLLNKELPVNKSNEKSKTVDVLAVVDNEYVHIELNSNNLNYLHNRNYIYFSNIYASKSKKGENYDIDTKFIHIDLTYRMKEGSDYKKYYVMSEDNEKYVDNIEIIEYNMDSLKKYWYNGNEEKYQKYKHLIMLDMDREELEKRNEGDEIMKEYKEKLDMLNDTEKYESFITPEEDLEYCLNTERNIGLREGIEQGEIKTALLIAKTLKDKNFSLEEISEIVKLPISKLKEILN